MQAKKKNLTSNYYTAKKSLFKSNSYNRSDDRFLSANKEILNSELSKEDSFIIENKQEFIQENQLIINERIKQFLIKNKSNLEVRKSKPNEKIVSKLRSQNKKLTVDYKQGFSKNLLESDMNNFSKKLIRNPEKGMSTIKENISFVNTLINNENDKDTSSIFMNKYESQNDSENNLILKKNLKNDEILIKGKKTLKLNENLNSRKILKTQKVYDSLSDQEIEVFASNRSNFLIFPGSKTKRFLDYSCIFIIIFSSLYSPYNSLFFKNFYFLEQLTEFFFFIEFISYFFTAIHDKNDNLIIDHRIIAIRYFKEGFLLNFISAFPFMIIGNISPSISKFHWIAHIRLLKLKDYDFLSDLHFFRDTKKYSIFKLSIIFLILTHLSTCFWVFIGANSNIKINWLVNNKFDDLSVLEKYINSMYFNIVTIFTIGYGDIIATNYQERIYNIFLLSVGVMIYAFGVTNLSTMFQKIDLNEVSYENKKSIFIEIKKEYKIPNSLKKQIGTQILLDCNRSDSERLLFLQYLPPHVKYQLTMKMYNNTIKGINFFKNQTSDFILFVLPFLQNHMIQKNEILLSVTDKVTEMYIVAEGCLSLTLGPDYENIEIATIKKGFHFGDLLLQTNQISPYELKSKSLNTRVYVLKKQDFSLIKNQFNSKITDIVTESLKKMENIERRRQQIMNLMEKIKDINHIKRLMKQINMYIMINNFDKFYYEGIDFEEIDEFIMKDEFDAVLGVIHKRKNLFQNVLRCNTKNLNNISNIIQTQTISERRDRNSLSTNGQEFFFNRASKLDTRITNVESVKHQKFENSSEKFDLGLLLKPICEEKLKTESVRSTVNLPCVRIVDFNESFSQRSKSSHKQFSHNQNNSGISKKKTSSNKTIIEGFKNVLMKENSEFDHKVDDEIKQKTKNLFHYSKSRMISPIKTEKKLNNNLSMSSKRSNDKKLQIPTNIQDAQNIIKAIEKLSIAQKQLILRNLKGEIEFTKDLQINQFHFEFIKSNKSRGKDFLISHPIDFNITPRKKKYMKTKTNVNMNYSNLIDFKKRKHSNYINMNLLFSLESKDYKIVGIKSPNQQFKLDQKSLINMGDLNYKLESILNIVKNLKKKG